MAPDFPPIDYETIKTALKEELDVFIKKLEAIKRGAIIYDWGGVKFLPLCTIKGYFAHDVEHLVDPRTGHEVLVCADPHVSRKVWIYDMWEEKVIWEYVVPGTAFPNPTIAHMFLEDVPDLNARAGDIVCPDRDNRVIIVDRDDKTIRKAITPSSVSYLHETLPVPGYADLLITDYFRSSISRMRADGTFVWDVSGIGGGIAKASLIPVGIHTGSFGGHIVVAENADERGVMEVNWDNGSIVWRKPPMFNGSIMNYGTILTKPHSAFRMAGGEVNGNPTVVGLEGGGGIVAIDYYGRPIWGFKGGYSNYVDYPGGSLYYHPNPCFLNEITDVFPTLDGMVGFASQIGYGLTLIGKLVGLPRTRKMDWLILWNYLTSDGWTELHPPISMVGWEAINITVQNIGANSVDIELYGVPFAYANYGWLNVWGMNKPIDYATIPSGEMYEQYIDKPYQFIRFRWKNSTPGYNTVIRAWAVQEGYG